MTYDPINSLVYAGQSDQLELLHLDHGKLTSRGICRVNKVGQIYQILYDKNEIGLATFSGLQFGTIRNIESY